MSTTFAEDGEDRGTKERAMGEFMYVLRPARREMLREGLTERERGVVGEHFRYLRGLCDRGVVVLAGRTITEDERVFGVCVLRAESEGEARGIMLADPAVAGGVMTAELFPFRVAMAGATKAAEM